ncbi:electron transfer flavoprotein subunit alpha/FixB family protein [Thermodesulfobacteriota bacterium]
MTKDIWIFVETRENVPHPVTAELLTPARELADRQGGTVTALVCGVENDALGHELIARGADRVFIFSDLSFSRLPPEAHARALTPLIEAEQPDTLLFGATSLTRDLAPRLATILKTGVMADCLTLDLTEEKKELVGTKPVPGGNLMATIFCPRHRPQVATLLAGMYEPHPIDTGRSGEIIFKETPNGALDVKVRIVGEEEKKEADSALDEAQIVVAGGMGLETRENFRLVEQLAQVLGGAVGATRPVVEEGWISPDHMIGQSGKIIRPRLYIAAGIYGSIYHTIGIQKAQTVVAINTDRYAPIFCYAHYAMVGDAKKILPAMIRHFR